MLKLLRRGIISFPLCVLLFPMGCDKADESAHIRYRPDNSQIFDYKNVMVKIPGGEIAMGSKPSAEVQALGKGFTATDFADETPVNKIIVEPYYLDKYEVSVQSYRQFLAATGHKPPAGWDRIDLDVWANYPIVNISWHDASAYAAWAGKRLPTEAEWELAARGKTPKRYPWGDKYNRGKARFPTSGLMHFGFNAEDISPYGIMGMAGNVAEWTSDTYNHAKKSKREQVIKGGWFGAGTPEEDSYRSRGAYRSHAPPHKTSLYVGFRCAMDVDAYRPPASTKPSLKDMALIPPGEFTVGTNPRKAEKFSESFGFKGSPYDNETPEHQMNIRGFYIDKYEVTIGRYKKFLQAAGYFRLPRNWKKTAQEGLYDNYPVSYVTWEDAMAYAQWVGKRLPSEYEWEKAARGPSGNIYPWGNSGNEEMMKLFKRKMMPIGSVDFDRSSYGVFDMGGNIAEWTGSLYLPYPGNDLPDQDYGPKYKVIRGGTNVDSGHYRLLRYTTRSAYRNIGLPHRQYRDAGFRCAYSKFSSNR